MSLDKRSIELGDGQWAVKEDKLFAFRKDRDKFFERSFDFSRASEGTIINSDGYIQYSGFGDELVTNGGFDTGTTGWFAYSDSDLSWDSNGYAVVTRTNFWTKIRLPGIFTVGKVYKIIITAKSNRTDLTFHDSGIKGSFFQANVFETFTQYYRATATNLDFGFANSGGETPVITIDSVSIKEVEQETPRISYDIVDGVVSDETHLLLEPARTNKLPSSEGFSIDTYYQVNYYNRTPNSIISPSGSKDATLLSETTYSGVPSLYKSGYTISLSGYNTFSIYVKPKNNARYFAIAFGSSVERMRTTFDFENSTFKDYLYNGSVTNGSASYELFGNGWYKITLTAEWVSAISNGGLAVAFLETDTYLYYLNQTSDNREFYLWGAQIEEGSYATSYIPTNGTIETRAAETANNSGNVGDFNDDEGVLYAEIAALADDARYKIISISNGTTNNRVSVGFYGDTYYFQIRNGGVAIVSNSAVLSNIQSFNRIAAKYKSGDIALWINGVEVYTSTATTMPIGLKTLSYDIGDGTLDFYSKTKQLKVYTEALNDAELRLLTKYAPKDYDVAFTADYVDTVAEINILRTEATDKLYYVISDGANEVSGSATITATEVTISNIDISSLNDGTLTVSVYIEDERKQRGVTVTDTTIKDNTNTPLYSYALQQRATGAVIEELDNAEAIIESLNVEV